MMSDCQAVEGGGRSSLRKAQGSPQPPANEQVMRCAPADRKKMLEAW